MDAYVESVILPRVIAESQTFRVVSLPPHGEDLAALEVEREELRAGILAGEVPSDVGMPLVVEIDRKREALEAERRMHILRERQLRGVTMTAEKWEAMSTDEKRPH